MDLHFHPISFSSIQYLYNTDETTPILNIARLSKPTIVNNLLQTKDFDQSSKLSYIPNDSKEDISPKSDKENVSIPAQ